VIINRFRRLRVTFWWTEDAEGDSKGTAPQWCFGTGYDPSCRWRACSRLKLGHESTQSHTIRNELGLKRGFACYRSRLTIGRRGADARRIKVNKVAKDSLQSVDSTMFRVAMCGGICLRALFFPPRDRLRTAG
jgi:hypothetical protein